MKTFSSYKTLSLVLLLTPACLIGADNSVYPFGKAIEVPAVLHVIEGFISMPAMLEHRRQVTHCRRKNTYPFGAEAVSVADMAKHEKNGSIDQQSNEYKKWLHAVIEDLVTINRPSLTEAQQAPDLNRMLLKAWSEQRNRTNSDLLKSEGDSLAAIENNFRAAMTSAVKLEQFCKDLCSFIDDIIQTFPNAWNRFAKQR